MYLYRVVPNSIMCSGENQIALLSEQFIGAEDIYYNLGYTSFIDEVGTELKNWNSYVNNINTNKSDIGKYFYLFPDDAMEFSRDVINDFGNKCGNTYSLLVYNFPIDVILENIGIGDYRDFPFRHAIETYINIDKFGNDVKDSSNIPSSEKFRIIKELFKSSITKECDFIQNSPLSFSSYLFNYMYLIDDNIVEKIEDNAWLDNIIQNSKLYSNLLKYNGSIVKSSHIKGINIPINLYDYSEKKQNNQFNISSILKEYGIYIEDNNEAIKKKIFDQLYQDKNDKEELKKILKK